MPKIATIMVTRLYKCNACEEQFVMEQKCSAPFRRKCPYCKKNRVTLKEGRCGLSHIMDSNTAKTLGAAGEQNTRRREKEGYVEPKKFTPWWRKGKKKVDLEVLKNPQKYISTGKK